MIWLVVVVVVVLLTIVAIIFDIIGMAERFDDSLDDPTPHGGRSYDMSHPRDYPDVEDQP